MSAPYPLNEDRTVTWLYRQIRSNTEAQTRNTGIIRADWDTIEEITQQTMLGMMAALDRSPIDRDAPTGEQLDALRGLAWQIGHHKVVDMIRARTDTRLEPLLASEVDDLDTRSKTMAGAQVARNRFAALLISIPNETPRNQPRGTATLRKRALALGTCETIDEAAEKAGCNPRTMKRTAKQIAACLGPVAPVYRVVTQALRESLDSPAMQ